MELKQYQRETLDVLRRFFEEARVAGPKHAYETITGAPECAERLGRYRGPYTAALADLPEVPYVCLRLPTGGGKTILGAHAVRVARDAWIEKDWPLVLWLAPTTTIRRQTAEALKKAGHPYREALDEAFGGRVRVFDIADFPHIRPQDLRDHCCLVVGTIQTLRVNHTEGRKVYAHHEDLESHFAAAPATVAALEEIAHERLTVHPTADGAVEIAVTGPVDERLEAALYDVAGEADRSGIAEEIERYRATTDMRRSPAQRGEPFTAPRLVCEIQGNLECADTDVFMEFIDWSPLAYPARLDEHEFTVRQTARSFEIDLDGRQIRHQFLDTQEQLALNVAVEGWTPERLVVWLERQVHEIDLDPDTLRKWLSDLVRSLTDRRGMAIAALMRCKFILARKIRDKIDAMRRKEEARAYRRYLFAPEAKVETTFDAAFAFRDGMYADQRRYRGRWKPSKYFLGPDAVPAFDGAEGGEEMQCAQALDRLPEMTSWIRNVARHPASFWLPLAAGKFYPDFVALLNDGRRFVVEYKGAHIADGPDTAEKRAVGALWEQRSAGKGLFLMAEQERAGLGVWDQLRSKVGR